MPLMGRLASTQHDSRPRTTRKYPSCFDRWLTSLIAVLDFAAPWFFVPLTGRRLKALKECAGVNCSNAPAYSGGGLESLFWLRETRCSYGEMTAAQLSRLGSRGKAARDMAPRLRQQLGIR